MTKNKYLNSLTVLTAALTFSGLSALAADFSQTESSTFPAPHPISYSRDRMPHIGLMVGRTEPEGRYNSSAEYGIDIGFQPYVPFGVGLEATFSELDSQLTDAKEERGLVLAKVTYNLGGNIPVIKDSYFGLGVGATIEDTVVTLASAPVIGFDIPIRDRDDQASVSIGANAKFLTVEGDEPDAASLNGVVKYWY